MIPARARSAILVTDDEGAFVRATYRTFLLNIAAMCVIGLASYHLLPNSTLLWLSIGDGVMWIACGWFGWRQPIRLVSALFVLFTGLVLGQLAHVYPGVLGLSSVLSLAAFVGLSLYVHMTRDDFSFLRGFLWAGFLVTVIGCLLIPYARNHNLNLLLAAFGTLVFAAWVLYDTSRILGSRDSQLSSNEAALDLFIDLVGLRGWLEGLLRGRA